MLIDVPQVSRMAFNIPGVYPTHAGAETLFTDLAPAMDKYAAEYCILADEAWAKHPMRPVKKIEVQPPEKKIQKFRSAEVAASGD